ncbi:MAG: phytanoyl-CoA dioxygenase family protein, partial [candidate division Zixibacteria bacterium]|nr:phytanoyl-CoA dioxygenase family protein [candidate division Zixibacteria bacterium]
ICSPIQHLRPKLPAALKYRGPLEGEAREKAEQTLAGYIGEHVAPWHQDAQVHLDEADPSFILTVWIPLCDATTENGCMEIVPRIHTRRMVYWHEGFGITEEQVPERTSAIPVPMKKGSVLLMHKFIPHRSTPNRTDGIRWSMDLRYQKTGKPTGRPHYPHFVAHSRRSPDSVMRDYPLWCNQWVEALDRVKKTGWPSREYRPVEPAEMKCDE